MSKQHNSQTIRVGSRGSRLALIQVDEIYHLLAAHGHAIQFEKTIYQNQGDVDKTTPLTRNVPDNFFTDQLDQALLNHKIDIAIHSAKDLPEQLPDGLMIFALTASVDDTDAFIGKVPFGQLKSGATIGTSSMDRQNNVLQLNPQLKTVDIRGTIDERLRLVDDGKLDGVIVATIALKRLGLENRIKNIMPWEAAPLQGSLAIVGRTDNLEMKNLFSSLDARKTYGRVYLVGAGPGDPELITQKGIKILNQADCVFYDYLTHKDLLNHAPRAEKIYVGKRKGDHTLPQAELSKMLRQKAMQGQTVVRLKGGDPLVFGRGADEITYLRKFHIDVEVIPGVSSATAIPATLGIPLTARGIATTVAFVSGHGEGEKESPALSAINIPDVDTIVFLMGLTKINEIIAALKHKEWKDETPIIIISKGTCIDQKIVDGTLGDIAKKLQDHPLDPPALIVIGETVKFWRQSSARHQKILYTGTNPQKYEVLGDIIHFPMIEIRPAELSPNQKEYLFQNLETCDTILFTSRFAPRYFFKILEQENYPADKLKSKDFFVIGRETENVLREFGCEAQLIAQEETGQGLLKEIKSRLNIQRRKILFPRSSLPNPYLKEELTKLGCEVYEMAIYENVKPQRRELPDVPIDRVIFTSPSTVNNFLADYGAIPAHWQVISKGPFTSEALSKKGYK